MSNSLGPKRKGDNIGSDVFFIPSYHWTAWCKQQCPAVKKQFWQYIVKASNKGMLTLCSVGSGEQHTFDILLKTAEAYTSTHGKIMESAKKLKR